MSQKKESWNRNVKAVTRSGKKETVNFNINTTPKKVNSTIYTIYKNRQKKKKKKKKKKKRNCSKQSIKSKWNSIDRTQGTNSVKTAGWQKKTTLIFAHKPIVWRKMFLCSFIIIFSRKKFFLCFPELKVVVVKQGWGVCPKGSFFCPVTKVFCHVIKVFIFRWYITCSALFTKVLILQRKP